MSNQFRERAQFRGLRNEKKIFRAIFRRTVLLEPTRADRFDIRAGSNVEFSDTTQDFGKTDLLEPTRADSSDIRVDSNVEQQTFLGKTALLEPTRADSWDIRVGSNVEKGFFIKPYGRPKRRSKKL